MKFGSLFSGIGGFDLALERAGMTCAWQCENDPKASAVLSRHWPNVENVGDVHDVRRGRVGTVDLICGGFPCQDLSIAGKRAGLAGKRSGLWYEFARVIDEFEPEWVIAENVPGLLSSDEGRDFTIIIQWLAKRGYGVAWRIFDAQYFGLAQRRRRVFIVGHLGDGCAAQVLFEREGVSGDPPTRGKPGKDTSYALRSNPSHSGDKGDGGINTTLIGTLSASAGGLDRPAGQGNELDFLVPDISRPLAFGETNNHGDESQQTYIIEQNNVASTPDMISLQSNPAQPVVFQQNTRDEPRLLGGEGQIAGALSSEPGMKQQNYIAFGGGNTSGPIDVATARNVKGDTRLDFDTETFLVKSSGVRRLTPTECERLQGFLDGWTDGQADSSRYRQLGNAVAVPVVEWIAKRITDKASCR